MVDPAISYSQSFPRFTQGTSSQTHSVCKVRSRCHCQPVPSIPEIRRLTVEKKDSIQVISHDDVEVILRKIKELIQVYSKV